MTMANSSDFLLEAMRGAACIMSTLPDEYRNDIHAAAGIERQEWAILTANRFWTTEQQIEAKGALDKLINASMTIANLPSMELPAEYVAAVIPTVVKPVNWMVAAFSATRALDGKKLIGPDGDSVHAREYLSPSRLFTLVIYYANSNINSSNVNANELYADTVNQHKQESEE